MSGLFEVGRYVGARATSSDFDEGPPPLGVDGSAAALAGALVSWRAFGVVAKRFDEGGAWALDWKKGTESLGEPLKIKTWGQFYKAAGPPAFARTAALIGSCFIAGAAASCAANALRRQNEAKTNGH